jgi:hypothetical protein
MTHKLRLNLDAAFLVAFLAIRYCFHELHEMMHMVLGRLLCGVWGTRDFNNVHPVSEACAARISPLVGLEGPMFNYLTIWLGAILILTARENHKRLSWGIVLVFASLPFARLFTALMGGGDELGVANRLIHDPTAARIADVLFVTLILFYPLRLACQRLTIRYQLPVFLGFLLLPMVLEALVVQGLFNGLLHLGVGDQTLVMGMPALVCVLFLLDLLLLGWVWSKLGRLFS